MIIPSHNLVIVRRGFDLMDEEGRFLFKIARFAADVMAALS
jgi:hypothetical protein